MPKKKKKKTDYSFDSQNNIVMPDGSTLLVINKAHGNEGSKTFHVYPEPGVELSADSPDGLFDELASYESDKDKSEEPAEEPASDEDEEA